MSDSQVRKYFTDSINSGVLQVIDLHDSYQYLTNYFNAFITDPVMEYAAYGQIIEHPMFLQKFRQDEQEYTIDRSPLNIAEVVVKLAAHVKLIRTNAETYFGDKERFPETDEKAATMTKRAGYLTDLLLFCLRVQLRMFYAIALKDSDLTKFTKKLYAKSVPLPTNEDQSSSIKQLLEEKATTDGFINFVVHEAEFRLSATKKTANVLVFLKELTKKKVFRTYGSFQLDEEEIEEVVLDEICRSTPRGAQSSSGAANIPAVSGTKRANSDASNVATGSAAKKQAGAGGRFVSAAFLANTRTLAPTTATTTTNSSADAGLHRS